MPAALLDSQFADLEPPGEDEDALTVDIGPAAGVQADEIVERLGLDTRVLGACRCCSPQRSRRAWNSHDTRLIVAAVLGIALIIVLIAVFKVHPFLALVAGSALTGFAAGVGSQDVIVNFESGVGATLQEVGLLIALGAMLGKLLAESGGADQVVDTLVSRAGPRMVPWAMGLVAIIVGLPMFFEIGLVLLLPVIVLVAKRSELPLMRVAIPALAGLSVLHGLIPPHPGPLIAISALNAQAGHHAGVRAPRGDPDRHPLRTAVLASSRRAGCRSGAPRRPAASTTGTERAASDDVKRPPSFAVTLGTILFPVVLMLLKALADIVWDSEPKNRAHARVRLHRRAAGRAVPRRGARLDHVRLRGRLRQQGDRRPARRRRCCRSPASCSSSAPAAASSRP